MDEDGAGPRARDHELAARNYDDAAAVAKQEALIDARFTLFRRGARRRCRRCAGELDAFLGSSSAPSASSSSSSSSRDLERDLHRATAEALRFARPEQALGSALGEVFRRLARGAPELFAPGAKRKSDFFRDIAGSRYHAHRRARSRKRGGLPFDLLLNVYDKSIIEVENRPPAGELQRKFLQALARVLQPAACGRAIGGRRRRAATIGAALEIALEEAYLVGTGYGRHAPAVPEGADPLGDPVPRARRAHHVSAARAPCSTSAARTPRPSRSTRTASSRTSR